MPTTGPGLPFTLLCVCILKSGRGKQAESWEVTFKWLKGEEGPFFPQLTKRVGMQSLVLWFLTFFLWVSWDTRSCKWLFCNSGWLKQYKEHIVFLATGRCGLQGRLDTGAQGCWYVLSLSVPTSFLCFPFVQLQFQTVSLSEVVKWWPVALHTYPHNFHLFSSCSRCFRSESPLKPVTGAKGKGVLGACALPWN